MILQNDAEGVRSLLNDSSIDFRAKNERGTALLVVAQYDFFGL